MVWPVLVVAVNDILTIPVTDSLKDSNPNAAFGTVLDCGLNEITNGEVLSFSV